MGVEEFGLSSEECELLVVFEEAGSLPALSRRLGKDVSVLSRQLTAIAGRAPVIEKLRHRWRLSDLGRSLNRWTLEAASRQKELLGQRGSLRIGASRAFSGRVLAPQIPALGKVLGGLQLFVLAFETPLEEPILSGRADIVLACGKPSDPLVAHRSLVPERYVAVASPQFVERFALRAEADLFHAPHLAYRDSQARYPFGDVVDRCEQIAAVLNDALGILAAVESGSGWTVLPYYAVRDGLRSGNLVALPLLRVEERRYGVWWLRDRRFLKPWADRLAEWLGTQEL